MPKASGTSSGTSISTATASPTSPSSRPGWLPTSTSTTVSAAVPRRPTSAPSATNSPWLGGNKPHKPCPFILGNLTSLRSSHKCHLELQLSTIAKDFHILIEMFQYIPPKAARSVRTESMQSPTLSEGDRGCEPGRGHRCGPQAGWGRESLAYDDITTEPDWTTVLSARWSGPRSCPARIGTRRYVGAHERGCLTDAFGPGLPSAPRGRAGVAVGPNRRLSNPNGLSVADTHARSTSCRHHRRWVARCAPRSPQP